MAKVLRYPGYDLLEGMDGKRAANSGPEFEIVSPIKVRDGSLPSGAPS
jgi:hypothetical protein